jgi:Phosphotransferase enzyme family
MNMSAPVLGARDHLPPPSVIDLAGHVLAGPNGHPRLLAHQPLKRFVHRLSFEVAARSASVVVKRLSPSIARVNELVADRWLPAGGLQGACPELLGVLQKHPGEAVWHVYEDVAGTALDGGPPAEERIQPVVELVVELHCRFVGHPLLNECREHGGELGIEFFIGELARAIHFLESLGSPPTPLSPEKQMVRDRLLNRVTRLYDEREERALLLDTWGGPETLLHGDLWPTNAVVVRRGEGFEARLIDWDRAGVGPVSYDLSTFLYRFPRELRPWVLHRYREAAARRGWPLPDDATLNELFETAEYARYACCLAAAARAALRREWWAFQELEEIDTWFAGLEPALAVERAG